MPDRAKLEDIFCRMESDYIPEHKQAADEYMKEGLPTELIFERIKVIKQPNLVSMYLYICGNRSNEETLEAWRYLQQRIMNEPENFQGSSPWELADNRRYLLFSARKYLLLDNKLNVFIDHMEEVKKEAEQLRYNILCKMDDIDCHFSGEKHLFAVRTIKYAIHRNMSDYDMFAEPEEELSHNDILLASQIASLDVATVCYDILGVDMIPLLCYQSWLINFFLRGIPERLKSKESRAIVLELFTRETLKKCFGYEENIERQFEDFRNSAAVQPPKPKESEKKLPIQQQEKGDDKSSLLFYIGFAWEQLCYEILQHDYIDLIRHPKLPNNSIPDIAVGTIQRNDFKEIIQISRIIECKKSIYFWGQFDTKNNDATDKYYLYCEHLEFWVLENQNKQSSKTLDNGKVKYVFATDLLDSPTLDEAYKAKIRGLLDVAKKAHQVQSPNSIEELRCAIDHILGVSTEDRRKTQAHKKEEIKAPPKTVIRQYQMDGTYIQEFESIVLAAKEIGVTASTISYAINGRRNSAGGFLWRKCEANSPIENITPTINTLDMTGKVIYQVDENGEVLATFETMREAEKKTGVNHRSISDALKGVQKTAGGFTWVLGAKV